MRAAALLPLLMLCIACTPRASNVEITGSTMGTQYSVKLPAYNGDVPALGDHIRASFDAVEAMMSTYRVDSEISRFNSNQSTAWQAVSAEFCHCVQQALALSELTGGAFDITVGPLVNLWGFGPGDMIGEPPAEARIEAMLQLVGYEHLQADCAQPALRKDIADLMLDMSAFGKGFAVDQVADWLEHAGLEDYMVEVGGEMRLGGNNASGQEWAIGIEAPLTGQRRPYTVVRLSDTAVATSGDYRNFFEAGGTRFSHTIDTRTGRPVTHSLASVTVVDARGYRADALATALLVLGPERGMQLATRENLAVLFLLRDDAGFDEQASPAFEQLRAS